LLDFSKIDDLKPLSRLVRRIQTATESRIPFVIVGAQARDLLLKHAHGIETGRQTADVDFAFQVASWEQFLELRERLIEGGDFTAVKGKLHKLLFGGKLEVDFVPFGPIETPSRTIAWPPDQDMVMSVFGFREGLGPSIEARLPEETSANVVSLPGLALLKVEAWRERRLRSPGKDAHDIKLILTRYLYAGNQDRLYDEFKMLLEDPLFDYSTAGAYALGHDIGAILDDEGRARVLKIMDAESDPDGKLLLVGDMRMDSSKGIELLGQLGAGLKSRT
jgi:predicted nucleotidyltransferase